MNAPNAPSTDHASRAFRVGCILLLIVALLFRLGWSLTRPSDRASLAALPDQLEYVQLADSLRAGSGLQFVDERFTSQEPVRAFRMPGYPAFVALFGTSVTWVRVVQAILDSSTVLATVMLARRLIGPMPALLAGAFVMLDPLGVYFQSLLLTETLSSAMLVWGMLLLARGAPPTARAPVASRLTWWAGIVVLLLSIYVRPSLLPFAFVLGLVSVFAFDGFHGGKSRRFATAFALCLLTLLAILPWAIRNRALLGEWIWTTTNDGFTLYDGMNPDATGASDQRWSRSMPLLQRMNELERNRYLSTLALEYAREHPARVVELALTKLGRLWSPVPLSSEYGRYALVAGAHAVPLFVLAIIALLPGGVMTGRVKLFLLTPALLITVLHAASVGSIRYRFPAHSPLAVLAASAFAGRRADRVDSELAITRETD